MQHHRFLFLESFFGGSHRAFAEGLVEHSRHRIDLLTLPAENWRWRTRAAALQFADRLAGERAMPPPSRHPAARPLRLDEYDGVIATDLLTLADFRVLVTGAPVLLYVHESQMTYPLPRGTSVDAATAFTDIRNVLMADRTLFNSSFHRRRFLAVAAEVLESAPSEELHRLPDAVSEHSGVLHPGCSIDGLLAGERRGGDDGPLIIWNHRWEYDKNPAPFFRTLERLSAEGCSFRVALLGENPQYHPKEFEAARVSLGRHIVQYGYVEDRAAYERLLLAGDIVVSTSVQENFGISVVEAVAAGCLPLLPHRLSYPEVIPAEYHGTCLYASNRELVSKLRRFVREGVPAAPDLREAMRRYAWSTVGAEYDRELEALAATGL
ncbi:MAG: tRNA-queuosine alpha-mannosyltransferase domain-containing protein [Spirochaetota bacterium]